MQEYKSKYINKTWNEITTSFDWVDCQQVNCRISHHKNHYDLQCFVVYHTHFVDCKKTRKNNKIYNLKYKNIIKNDIYK